VSPRNITKQREKYDLFLGANKKYADSHTKQGKIVFTALKVPYTWGRNAPTDFLILSLHAVGKLTLKLQLL
jgi:hypothetical protein